MEGGGLALIRVRDNGGGIPAADVPLSPLRHATSKLESVDRVTTLGFRGEALWAAAQAGQLKLVTRPPTQLGATQLTAHGEAVAVGKVSAPAGTSVSVSDLFKHLPARLRTQLPAAAELREITALLTRYVLHWPGLHWKLTVDGDTRAAARARRSPGRGGERLRSAERQPGHRYRRGGCAGYPQPPRTDPPPA